LIIDEAHNIKQFAEESSNFKITLETLKHCLKELEWIEGSLREDQNTGPGIEITRDFVTHWSNFIQHKKHSEGIIDINYPGFPLDAIVLEEKQLVDLVKMHTVRGLNIQTRIDQITNGLQEAI